MSNPATANLEPTDGAYEQIAEVVRSNVSLMLAPFKSQTAGSESFLNEFIRQADQFCDRCSYEAAKIMRQCTIVPEIRGLPTAVLAAEIRKEVFQELDRPVQGLKNLRNQVDELDASLKGGLIDDSERYDRGTRLLMESRSLMLVSAAEYLGEIGSVAERLLDYCCAHCYGSEVSLDRQQAVIESAQLAIKKEIELILQRIQATSRKQAVVRVIDEKKAKHWSNDPASPKLWFVFFAAMGVVFLLIVILALFVK